MISNGDQFFSSRNWVGVTGAILKG